MTRVVVRQDEIGPYVKHGDDKVRPLPDMTVYSQLAGRPDSEVKIRGRQMMARRRNKSHFSTGDKVDKHHYCSSVKVRVSAGGVDELWDIHSSDEAAQRSLDAVTQERNRPPGSVELPIDRTLTVIECVFRFIQAASPEEIRTFTQGLWG